MPSPFPDPHELYLGSGFIAQRRAGAAHKIVTPIGCHSGELASGEAAAYVMLERIPGGRVTSLAGKLLVAMPQMIDHRFARSVIYLCVHNDEGAMGLVINKLVESLTMGELLKQLGIAAEGLAAKPQIHFGGPVEVGKGFVLHSADYIEDGTLKITKTVALTATIDILRAIGRGEGPRRSLLALGYAGWGPGQLDAEIQANGWLHVDADDEIVFDGTLEDKWKRALGKLGVDILALSGEAGHA
jgi:putative transcriptional regulator